MTEDSPVYTEESYYKAESMAQELARGNGPWDRWSVVEEFDGQLSVGPFLVMPDEAAEAYLKDHDAEIQYTAARPS